MDLADENGIDSVTMRELGRRLGVKAASLYNHIAGKDDLLDGMMNLVLSEIDVPLEDVDWKDAMRRRAISARKVFARHRWAAGLIDSRDRTGPGKPGVRGPRPGRAHPGRLFARGRGERVPRARQLHLRLRAAAARRPDGRQDRKAPRRLGRSWRPSRTASTRSPACVAAEYAASPFDLEAAFEFGLGLILDGLERTLGLWSPERSGPPRPPGLNDRSGMNRFPAFISVNSVPSVARS
ncbi:MAG: TetR family transcriptional regulator [Candidatus Moduliflexus flocculans]|nr:TetR family transcriptional regulator [Candidatus Moduliflexus flocculans]